jgi:hypothetical protein
MSCYCKLKDSWTGLQQYNLVGPKSRYIITTNQVTEEYTPPITLSLPEWKQYVSSGNNVLLGSGGVIPGSTIQTPFGGKGVVYKGNVRQGYGVIE